PRVGTLLLCATRPWTFRTTFRGSRVPAVIGTLLLPSTTLTYLAIRTPRVTRLERILLMGAIRRDLREWTRAAAPAHPHAGPDRAAPASVAAR
ncbi:MAG TPA: hypothetical protein VFY23_12170, partial [Candidatus Limnocylindrales bacterium]|nr:hypothetical protein [Candidatus Limnocylindrales bacterium]